ncbi:hypothetical protein Tco_1045528 [Tanacetum coccineum]|uniref:Uncharacterized protein n=1 Tax=Tanacetum coccineum TaxID=301880 RepID=A0ABQ5GVJ5_9ASTR
MFYGREPLLDVEFLAPVFEWVVHELLSDVMILILLAVQTMHTMLSILILLTCFLLSMQLALLDPLCKVISGYQFKNLSFPFASEKRAPPEISIPHLVLRKDNQLTVSCSILDHALFFGFVRSVDLIRHKAGVYFGYQVNSSPSGLVRISPAPDPSRHDDPSVNRIYGSEVTSSVGVSTGGSSSFGHDRICLMGWSVITTTGCAWKYRLSLLISLSASKTALTASLAAQKTPFLLLMSIGNHSFHASFRVLKKGSEFSTDLDKNLFRLASFPLRLCASFNVQGDCNFITAFAFSGQALIPFMLTTWPRNAPSFAPNAMFRYGPWNACHVCWFPGNIFRLSLSRLQSSILPFSDRFQPIVTVCSGYSGWIATLIPFVSVDSWGGGPLGALVTILHSTGIVVLLRIVTIPPSTGNFSIPWAVDGTAWIFLRLGWLMIPLYGNGDLTTMKFIVVLVECSPSPKDTISDIFPNGQVISLLNPIRGVVARTIWFFISGWSLLKQCLYSTPEADPPSTHRRWMRCPSTSARSQLGFLVHRFSRGARKRFLAMRRSFG